MHSHSVAIAMLDFDDAFGGPGLLHIDGDEILARWSHLRWRWVSGGNPIPEIGVIESQSF